MATPVTRGEVVGGLPAGLRAVRHGPGRGAAGVGAGLRAGAVDRAAAGVLARARDPGRGQPGGRVPRRRAAGARARSASGSSCRPSPAPSSRSSSSSRSCSCRSSCCRACCSRSSSLPAILQPLVAIMPLPLRGRRAARWCSSRAPTSPSHGAPGRRRSCSPSSRRCSRSSPRSRSAGTSCEPGRPADGAPTGLGGTRGAGSSTRRGPRSASVATTAPRCARSPRDAGVDPALVHHYFGTKQRLFVAAIELPVRPPARRSPGWSPTGRRELLGERFVRFVVALWDRPDVRPTVTGVVRSATTDPVAAAMARRMLAEGPLLALDDGDRARPTPSSGRPSRARSSWASPSPATSRGRAAGVDVAGRARRGRRAGRSSAT